MVCSITRGPGEADQGAGLGQDDVPQAGKAGGDAAGGGVGEHGDVEAALLGEPLQGGGGLGHLHQGEDALLHPGPAAGGEKDEGELVLVGVLHQPGDLLPDGGGHAAHEKAAVQGAHGHPLAARCGPAAVTTASFMPVRRRAPSSLAS